jgi:hypothetical protein
MPSVFIQVPTEKVFEALCGLTRHVKWANHNIVIEAGQEAPPAVGNTYTSSHKGGSLDRLTVTEMTPNERFTFRSVMPNNWEIDFSMTASAQGEGTLVTCACKIAKIPILMSPMKLMFALVAPGFDKKFLNNMKNDLEGAG